MTDFYKHSYTYIHTYLQYIQAFRSYVSLNVICNIYIYIYIQTYRVVLNALIIRWYIYIYTYTYTLYYNNKQKIDNRVMLDAASKKCSVYIHAYI